MEKTIKQMQKKEKILTSIINILFLVLSTATFASILSLMSIFWEYKKNVATLVDEYIEAGSYEVTFDASRLTSGVYFYKLQAGSFTKTKKMIIIR